MNSKRVTLVIASILLLGGCGGLADLFEAISFSQDDTANYEIHDVELIGSGGPGVYTVRWRFVYVGGPGVPGGPALGVRPMVALVDDDAWFRDGDDVIAGEQHVPVNNLVNIPFPSSTPDEASFTLNCVNGDVEGNLESSAEGTAEIYGRVERANGDGGVNSTQTIDVECP